MKILVVGCGSIGRRHIRNIISLGHIPVAVDLNEEYRQWVSKKFKIRTYDDIDSAIEKENPTVSFICTPPNSHVPVAEKLVDNGLHVFIEKPISNSLKGVDNLLKKAEKRNLRIVVGYNLRFNRGIRKIKELIDGGAIGRILFSQIEFGQYLPDWRPWQDYRKSYTAQKSLGGGIILDASHEIDYSRWLMGEADSVTCVSRKISDLDVDTEDTADMIIGFRNGSTANIHLDFVRRDYKRGCVIVGEKGTLTFNFGNYVTLYSASKNKTKRFKVRSEINDMYLREVENFLDCIKNNKEPPVNGEEGKKTLIVTLAAKKSSEKRKTIRIG